MIDKFPNFIRLNTALQRSQVEKGAGGGHVKGGGARPGPAATTTREQMKARIRRGSGQPLSILGPRFLSSVGRQGRAGQARRC